MGREEVIRWDGKRVEIEAFHCFRYFLRRIKISFSIRCLCCLEVNFLIFFLVFCSVVLLFSASFVCVFDVLTSVVSRTIVT